MAYFPLFVNLNDRLVLIVGGGKVAARRAASLSGFGCRILATVHGASMEELRQKPLFHQLIRRGCFERYVLLGNQPKAGQVLGIYDERGSLLYREECTC